jgi:hypothetical protein
MSIPTPHLPAELYVEVTNRCNSQCQTCTKHRQRAHLTLGQTRKIGTVTIEQGIATLQTAFAVDRHAGDAEGIDVPVDCALRDFQFPGELPSGHSPPSL